MSSPSKPRAFAALAKPESLDATSMANTGKALMRTLKTLTTYKDLVTWKVNFMDALWFLDANAVHIAQGNLTPLHKIKDDGSGEQEEVAEGDLPKHVVAYDCTSTEEQRKSESEGVRGEAPRGAPSSAREVADPLSPVILKTFSYDPTSARPYPARVPRVPG